MQTCSGRTGTQSPESRWRTFQPLELHSQSMNAATALGEQPSIFTLERLRMPYGYGIGSATIEGWVTSPSLPPVNGR